MKFHTMHKYRHVYFPREVQERLERRAAAKGPEFLGRYWAMRAIRKAGVR